MCVQTLCYDRNYLTDRNQTDGRVLIFLIEIAAISDTRSYSGKPKILGTEYYPFVGFVYREESVDWPRR